MICCCDQIEEPPACNITTLDEQDFISFVLFIGYPMTHKIDTKI